MQKGWNRFIPYFLILPNVLLFTVFILVPLLWIFYLSLNDYTMLNAPKWVGLKNYSLLLNDSIFHQAVKNTALYWIGTVVPSMLLGLVLANLLSMRLKALAAFRALIYLPGVISSVAVAMTWLWMLDPLQGPVNSLLGLIGIDGRNWLQDPATSLPTVIVIGIWTGIGYAMIIFLAGIQSISESLYEAASLDGASVLKKFWYITVPLLKPMTLFLFVTSTIRSFQVFDLVFVLTGGGPANSSTTIVTQIVGASFQEYRMGYASAMAVFLLALTLFITLIQYAIGSRNQAGE
ncbi:multiple sugar transport system permease protein [Paenibacillus algorifonticola]|uniref:Multiple sugar transport system permease protein n=1 Tax=Paenibacillus algorifonticola TaxID=684063 RepID=A0A1I2CFT9_9BACL|nr:sugar ABC transporter permease [Paenibacillus algorifonticola]SFE67227.1 multiple sugar transport system permease protein [Paenibacillus algorifonticola]